MSTIVCLSKSILEQDIEKALDLVDNQVDFKDNSNLKADIPLSIINQEKLARSIIDQGELYDEREKKYRQKFDRNIRIKRIGKVVIALSLVGLLLLYGVIRKEQIRVYPAEIYASHIFSAGRGSYPVEEEFLAGSHYVLFSDKHAIMDELNDQTSELTKKDCLYRSNKDQTTPEVNKEKLNDTLDKLLSVSFDALHYAYDEKSIREKEYYKDMDGNWYLHISLYASCIDYAQENEDDLKWKDVPEYKNAGLSLIMGNACYENELAIPPIMYFGSDTWKSFGELSTKTYIAVAEIIVKL